MKLSDEQIQDLLRVGNPTDEECRLIRTGWDAALARMRTQGVPVAALRPVIDWLRNGCDPQEAAKELEILIAASPEAKP